MKIKEIDERFVEILQDYEHPHWHTAYQMIEEENFETDGNTNKQSTATDGDNSRGVWRAYASLHEILKAV